MGGFRGLEINYSYMQMEKGDGEERD